MLRYIVTLILILNYDRSEAKGDDNKPGTGFTLLCNNLRETVELFRRDLYKLIFIQHGLANGSSGKKQITFLYSLHERLFTTSVASQFFLFLVHFILCDVQMLESQ